jgi:ABC-type Fe3+ transport system substrate-binding protein
MEDPAPEAPKTSRKVEAFVSRAVGLGRRLKGRMEQSVVLRRWGRELAVVTLLLATLAAPFLLKPRDSVAPRHYDRRLVILTPHHEKIRHEFGLAFTEYWKQKHREALYVDWRVAGTSEAALILRSEYAGAFEFFWTNKLGREWTPVVAGAFANSKVKPATAGTVDAPVEEIARREFLESDVGIGVDLFFGGGSFDYEQQAKAGTLVAANVLGDHGLKQTAKEHPAWFGEGAIPQTVSGETFYDPEKRWVGTCLSAMGIVFNRDVLERLGIEKQPEQWADLADPRYRGQVALSDPNKSGSVAKAFEQLIQQQMQMAVQEVEKRPSDPAMKVDLERVALSLGWERGLRLIQRICANARYFTDNATKIPLEVAQGDAAAGMCVDFYGRSFEEQCRRPDGSTRVGFVSPVGGASVSVDPVGMLRGAPEAGAATEFMEFVLSDAGQRLWNFQVGAPGGPVKTALRRLPVRKDFYTEANLRWMTDARAEPFEVAKSFTYHPEWTGSLFNVIRFLVRVMCVDVHDEQRKAWRMLVRTDFPKRATEVFENVALVNYETAKTLAVDLGRKDKELEVKIARQRSGAFRAQYEQAYELARRGQ